MEYVIVSLAALLVAALTLFSGFGLGTILMPVFALFFPVEVAVGATAIVHLANNIFKAVLVGKKADWKIVGQFAVPAAITAVIGALLLNFFSNLPPVIEYSLAGQMYQVMVVKLVIAVLMIGFALFELVPRLEMLSFDRRYLPVGGGLSGFFGGLSGHQGALRSAFLLRLGLDKEAFIGTGVMAAVVVDVSRLTVYGATFFVQDFAALSGAGGVSLVITAIMAAFLGSYFGARMIKKVTMRAIRLIVGIMLVLLAISLAAGLV